MECQSNLLEMIGALRSACGLPGGLDRGQQKGNQNADNCNDDQELNQRKPAPRVSRLFSAGQHDIPVILPVPPSVDIVAAGDLRV
jgi:hypothetical protein